MLVFSHRLMYCPPNPICLEYFYEFVLLFLRSCVDCFYSFDGLQTKILFASFGLEHRKEELKGLPVCWSDMHPTLQATQPSLLCNWSIPWGIPKLPTSTLTDTWISKHGLAQPCLQSWMTWSHSNRVSPSPEYWSEFRYSPAQTDLQLLNKKKKA